MIRVAVSCVGVYMVHRFYMVHMIYRVYIIMYMVLCKRSRSSIGVVACHSSCPAFSGCNTNSAECMFY